MATTPRWGPPLRAAEVVLLVITTTTLAIRTKIAKAAVDPAVATKESDRTPTAAIISTTATITTAAK